LEDDTANVCKPLLGQERREGYARFRPALARASDVTEADEEGTLGGFNVVVVAAAATFSPSRALACPWPYATSRRTSGARAE